MLLNIAKLLLEEKLLNYESIKEVLEKSEDLTVKNFQDSLINYGYIDRQALEDTISKNFGAKIEDIKNLKVDESILKLIRKKTAAANLVLPIRISDSKLVVAMTNPSDLLLLDKLSFETGYIITPVIASKETIRNTVIKNYKIDFNDQEILIDSLEYSDTAENILSQLKEFDEKAGETIEKITPEVPKEDNHLDYNPFKSANAEIFDIQNDNVDKEKEILLNPENIDIQDNNPFISAVVKQYVKNDGKVNFEKFTGHDDSSDDNNFAETSPFKSAFSNKKSEVNNEAEPIKKEKISETIEDLLQLGHNSGYLEPAIELEETGVYTETDSNSLNYNPFQSALSDRTENVKIAADKQTESNKNPFEIENAHSGFQIIEESDPVIINKEISIDSKAVLYTKNILVVDKSLTIQKIISQALEKKGYNVTKSSNPVDAITQINNNKPDLILLDIKLPHLDGYHLCRIIKKNADTKDIPVILLSDKKGVFSKLKGKMAGADAYITKPLRSNILTDIVEKLTSI
ncbi:MAG: response regulator [Thermodesulfobacteriota bacterium]